VLSGIIGIGTGCGSVSQAIGLLCCVPRFFVAVLVGIIGIVDVVRFVGTGIIE
jgi:hypothetical protein